MRLQNYIINEGRRSKEISFDKAKEILYKECSNALKTWKANKGYIYRGIEIDYIDYLYEDSTKIPDRESTNATNEYTMLFNHILESWKKYPRRQIICTTDSINAESYGTIYNVFPFNGTKIGICPAPDIWWSFNNKTGGNELYIVNSFLRDIFGSTNIDNVNKLKLELMNTSRDHVDPNILYEYDYLTDNWKPNVSLYTYLDNVLLNPNANGFKIVKSGQRIPLNKEVWFDGKVLFIKYWLKDIMDKFI